MEQKPLFDIAPFIPLTARRKNVLRSPKQHGSSLRDSRPYLEELGVGIQDAPQPIQFQPNTSEPVHRWSPYVQGFSAQFVQRTLDRYREEYNYPVVADPFVGSGTVTVQAKMNGCPSFGVELNPLLHFVARVKVGNWRVSPERLLEAAHRLPSDRRTEAPAFLQSERHFRPPVLRNLERLKGGIDSFQPATEEDVRIRDLMLLAFAAILIDCSNLKRSPCLGYAPGKFVADDAPFTLFAAKIAAIADDLRLCQTRYREYLDTPSEIILANSMEYQPPVEYDLVITSPPYMNGLDYVMNYKIEIGWLGYARTHQELKGLKDAMVVCDNVSKGVIRRFSGDTQRYTNPWIEHIKADIAANIARRGFYRREDMPEIVHKYFDDMYLVMRNVSQAIRPGGRFILVVGDSLIADVYVPTDLILARIGQELGLKIERLERARVRRSGQIRSYRLRETIITLKKE
ncbi:MAG: hypothetical protein N2556_00270 [Anaerolineae bacterium]|nr:hypothetical protein [Anaerolineae bacterium]